MKKQIITLGITATLAISALLTGVNGIQFVQQEDSQAIYSQVDQNLLFADGGGENWGGG